MKQLSGTDSLTSTKYKNAVNNNPTLEYIASMYNQDSLNGFSKDSKGNANAFKLSTKKQFSPNEAATTSAFNRLGLETFLNYKDNRKDDHNIDNPYFLTLTAGGHKTIEEFSKAVDEWFRIIRKEAKRNEKAKISEAKRKVVAEEKGIEYKPFKRRKPLVAHIDEINMIVRKLEYVGALGTDNIHGQFVLFTNGTMGRELDAYLNKIWKEVGVKHMPNVLFKRKPVDYKKVDTKDKAKVVAEITKYVSKEFNFDGIGELKIKTINTAIKRYTKNSQKEKAVNKYISAKETYLAGNTQQQEIDYLIKMVEKKLELDKVATFKFEDLCNPFKDPRPSAKTVEFYHDLYVYGDKHVVIEDVKGLLKDYIGVSKRVITDKNGIKKIIDNKDRAYDSLRSITTIFSNRYTNITMGEAMDHIAPVVLDKIIKLSCDATKDHKNTAKRVKIQKMLKTSQLHRINGYLVKLNIIVSAKESIIEEDARIVEINKGLFDMAYWTFADYSKVYNFAAGDRKYSDNLENLIRFISGSTISRDVEYSYNEDKQQIATYTLDDGSTHVIDLRTFTDQLVAGPPPKFDINDNRTLFMNIDLEQLDFDDIIIEM